MLTVYANGMIWTRWPDMNEAPVTVVLPLPAGEQDIDLPRPTADEDWSDVR